MGFFSWKYCDSKDRMICGKRKNSYLLIPEEFGGGHIVETYYDGYGHMGYVDVYEEVANWNRKYLTEELINIPDRRSWDDTPKGQERYEKAMRGYRYRLRRLIDFRNGTSDSIMRKNYGEDWKREIGIDIACEDKDNARLKYPIKIAEKEESVYEKCRPSKGDPMQGCY